MITVMHSGPGITKRIK